MTSLQQDDGPWKHEHCTFENRIVSIGIYRELQVWCKEHNERIVSKPV